MSRQLPRVIGKISEVTSLASGLDRILANARRVHYLYGPWVSSVLTISHLRKQKKNKEKEKRKNNNNNNKTPLRLSRSALETKTVLAKDDEAKTRKNNHLKSLEEKRGNKKQLSTDSSFWMTA